MSDQLPELPKFALREGTILLDTPDFKPAPVTPVTELKPKAAEPKKDTASSIYAELKRACTQPTLVVQPPPKTESDAEENPLAFGFSIDGPTMGAFKESEPTLGELMMQKLGAAALTSHVDVEDLNKLSSLVEGWQQRLDLAGVAVGTYGMSRFQSVTRMADSIEAHIMERIHNLPLSEALSLLKILHKDRLAFASLLSNKASSPPLTSPESLAGSLAGKVDEEAKATRVSTIKPEARKRLVSIMSRFKKVVTVESEVVSSEPAKA